LPCGPIAAIGDRDAAPAVARIIAEMQDATRLQCGLPAPLVLDLLRHPDPAMRADAARCVHRVRAETVTVLIDLLDHLHPAVAQAAARASEARDGRRHGRR
jgi:hypothetical protein